MPASRDVDVNQLTDNLPVGGITYLVLALCFGAMLSEGYSLGVPALAAPGIITAFGVSRAALAPVFSVALFGMLLGALIAGYAGDRFGRKQGILATTAIICLGSFGCAMAQSLEQLFWLRLVVGLGLGGLLPNGAALMAELTAKKVRAAFTSYAFIGIVSGGMITGIVGAHWHDWRLLFAAGGVLSLILLAPIFLFLPELPKFLALDPARRENLHALLMRLSPRLALSQDAHFVLMENNAPFRTGMLFAGALRFITPAVWLAYFTIMLVNFFINSWLPLILADMGFSAAEAALLTSFFYVGGIIGGLVVGWALDRAGPLVLGLAVLVGAGATLLMDVAGNSFLLTGLLTSLIGFGVLGVLVGTSGLIGLIYPTAMRAKGAGVAYAVGRLGGISGPLVAGVMMQSHAGIFTLFLVPAACMLVAAPCYLVICGAWTGRLLGRGLAAIDAAPG